MRARSTCVVWWAAPCSRLKPSQRCCQSASACSAVARSSAERALGGLGLHEVGRQLFDLGAQRGDLALVALDVAFELGQRRARLRELVALLLAQLAHVRDRLLGAADVRADFVVARLHRAHALGLLVLVDALRLDGGFGGALIGERLLHRELALAHGAVLHFGAGIDFAQTQREQFGGEPAFGFLQRLVAARGGGLTLQMADLLVDFVAHVLQAFEVFARVGDARLGFLAALLVPGDAGGFFDEARACLRPWPR